MSTTKNLKIPYPLEGIIRSAQLSDTVAPENSAQLAVNGVFDRIGSFMTRKGISTFATQLSGKILAFGSLSIQSTGLRRLLAQVGNDISSWDGTTWTSVRTLTSTTNKARFSQYLNLTYMVNGNASVAGSDAPASFDGTSFGTTNVPATLPKGDYISAGFEGRIWVADQATDTLYYTDIVQFTAPSTYTITAENPCGFVKNLSPQDGESITGLFRIPRALLVFKQNHIFRVYGATSADPYPAYNVGTYSQESIVQAKDGLYFHHPSGFYKFSYDGQPIEISRRIIDFVQAIPRTSYEHITGVYDGFDHVLWNIGTVTVEGVTYPNCIVRYTISSNVWTVYDVTGENKPSANILYDNGTLIAPLVGTEQGKIGRLEDGQKDFGLDIYFEMITRWISFTELWSRIKRITGFAVQSENGAGAELEFQTDKDGVNVWEDAGKYEQKYATVMPNADTDDFNRIRFRTKGYTSGPQIVFNGIEILSLNDKGFDQN